MGVDVLSRPAGWQAMLSGKTIAVTGASGFIAGRLLERLAGIDCLVMRVSRGEAGSWDTLAGADVIFHLAAQTSVAVAAADPDADYAANVEPMRQLLAACRMRKTHPVVVFAGTVTVAGIPRSLPVNEDATDNPLTVYDAHKLAAERELNSAVGEGAVSGATLRLANVYGPGTTESTPDRGVFNRMIRTALDGGPLTLYGDGAAIRDYVFVDDVVEAFLAAAAGIASIDGRHFVIGSGQGTSIRDGFALIASRAEARLGRPVRVINAEPPPGAPAIEQRNFIADYSRFAAATGWRPRWSLSDGIDRTIEERLCA